MQNHKYKDNINYSWGMREFYDYDLHDTADIKTKYMIWYYILCNILVDDAAKDIFFKGLIDKSREIGGKDVAERLIKKIKNSDPEKLYPDADELDLIVNCLTFHKARSPAELYNCMIKPSDQGFFYTNLIRCYKRMDTE